jgi:hypothetical protein
MVCSSNAMIRALLGAGLAAAFVAGCGGATATATPVSGRTTAPSASVGTSAGASTGASGSPSASPLSSASLAAPTEEPSLDISAGLAHLDAKFETLLPGIVGGIPLSKTSMPLSTFMASEVCDATNPCADKALYTPWIAGFGKTPDDATFAAATDLTKTEKILVQAFKLPGVDGAKLIAAFTAEAKSAGWAVSPKTIAAKSVQEMIDPARQSLDLLSVGYAYAKDDVMYIVSTDDPALLVEALIKLP